MKKFLSLQLALLAVAAPADETLFELEITPEKLPECRIETVAGKPCIALKGKNPVRLRLPEELSRFENKQVTVSYTYRIKNVPEPDMQWNGFKVLTEHFSNGKRYYGHAKTPWGSSDWSVGSYNYQFREKPVNGTIILSIPGGEAWLGSFAITYRDLPPKTETGGIPTVRIPLPEPTPEQLRAVAFTVLKEPLKMTVAGEKEFSVRATLPDGRVLEERFSVEPQTPEKIENEPHHSLPVLDPYKRPYFGASKYRDGKLIGTIRISSSPGSDAEIYTPGKDYIDSTNDRNVGIGRNPESSIKRLPVYFTYTYLPARCDSVILAGDRLVYRTGETAKPLPGFPRYSRLEPPALKDGEIRLGNVYIKSGFEKLTPGALYPIQETAYPIKNAPSADELLPKTMNKLREGEPLRILAWGDSITAGRFEPGGDASWQQQVIKELRHRFPKAQIELVTEAWGGHASMDYLRTAPKDLHNYQTSVLDRKPDLIISHWHNDHASSFPFYPKYLRDFRAIGAEWLPVASLCTRSDEDHPNDYGALSIAPQVIKFARDNRLPIADAAARSQRLWRLGIPRLTYMAEGDVHPGIPGMKLIADAVLEVFPEK